MVLLLVLLFLVFIEVQFRISIRDLLSSETKFIHSVCLELIQKNYFSSPVAEGLVCGKPLRQFFLSSPWLESGLIHLLVVSGSHLSLLRRYLSKIHFNDLFIFLLLLIYSLACLFNPPIARSLFQFGLVLLLRYQVKYWPTHFIVLISGLITLLIDDKFISSVSLQMSWMAGLTLVFIEENIHEKINQHFMSPLLFFLLFLLTYTQLGLPSITIVVFALVMVPFLELILFPLALVTLISPPAMNLFDQIIQSLYFIIEQLEFQTLRPESQVSLITTHWIIIIFLHIYLWGLERAKT